MSVSDLRCFMAEFLTADLEGQSIFACTDCRMIPTNHRGYWGLFNGEVSNEKPRQMTDQHDD